MLCKIRCLVQTYMSCGRKFHSEINPFRIIWINPPSIIFRTPKLVLKSCTGYCHVMDGDWDLAGCRFDEYYIYKMMREHFIEGIEWTKTSQFPIIIQTIHRKGRCWNNCRSELDANRRCDFLDQLYKKINEEGYRIPPGIEYGKPGIARISKPEEIAVNIGRDGGFFYENGRHRLSIAKILELPIIPVRVVTRHRLWMDVREQVSALKHSRGYKTKSKMTYGDHPDLSYL